MSTWGQLRLLLQQDAGELSPDLLDGYLNTRYGDVLDRWPWKGLEVETSIQTTAAYNTGTVSVTQGSNAIVGTGTIFTSAMNGMSFRVTTDNAVYTFTFVTATTATLDRNYEDDTNATATFWIYEDEYVLPAPAKTLLTVVCPVTGEPLADWTTQKIIDSMWPRESPGIPIAFAMAADTNENTPPVYHTLKLSPPPMSSRGYPLRYQKATAGFDGQTTGAAPLPWISDNVLLCGCRADIKHKLKDYTGAEAMEAKFEKAIAVMLNVDAARRGNSEPVMAKQWSAYRTKRVLR
ncbi:MAG TPA: hypothetical protein VK752_05200 [Bryobacteraceae bacterium]|jgi:hypothetical protein|nr:hypothetical protein [Bryobacteraceae bacterium]